MATKISVDGIINHMIKIKTKVGKDMVMLFLSEKRMDDKYNNFTVRIVGEAATRFINEVTLEQIKDNNSFIIFKSDQTALDTQKVEATTITYQNGENVKGNTFNADLIGITVFDYTLDRRVKGAQSNQASTTQVVNNTQQTPSRVVPQQPVPQHSNLTSDIDDDIPF